MTAEVWLLVQTDHDKQIHPLSVGMRLTLGRHRTNTVILPDEHCSRHHAEVFEDDGVWCIRDLGSQNGILINGQRINAAVPLAESQEIKVGQVRLRFCRRAPVEEDFSTFPPGPAADPLAPEDVPTPLHQSAVDLLQQTVLSVDRLAALCQFMAATGEADDAQALVRLALETVQVHTGAAVVGFLGLDEEDELVPRVVLPDASRMDYPLSKSLTAWVARERQSLWLGQEKAATLSGSLASFQDAFCVPLPGRPALLGVLHAYRQGRAFAQSDVQFGEIVGQHLASCLRRVGRRHQLEAENSRLRLHSPPQDQILGDSVAMVRLRRDLERLAPHRCPVLIRGESGVGKELVANALHRLSPRVSQPFVVVNCAAIPLHLLESELFGHKKGAFTDANRDRDGCFLRADGGTLFLDEVGELPLECQAKLLRVLENHPFTPLGGKEEVRVRVRFVAATNRDLETEVREGKFRRDLYYRLKVVEVQVPPLRDHAEDVPQLAEAFLDWLVPEYGRRFRLTPEALARLQRHPWPGNVRQLRHALENAVAFADKEWLTMEDLRLDGEPPSGGLPTLNVDDLTRLAVIEAMRRTGNSLTEAARLLGLARSTVYTKAKLFDLLSD